MAVEMEGLSFQIEANAGDSAKQLDSLASSLAKLKEASGGLKLGQASTQLKKLSEALSGVDTKSVLKLKQMSKALSALGSVSKISISNKLAPRIAEIGKSMDEVSDEKIERLNRLADALVKLGSAGSVRIPSLKNLGKATDTPENTVEYAPATVTPEDRTYTGGGYEQQSPFPAWTNADVVRQQIIESQYELSSMGKIAINVSHAMDNIGNAASNIATRLSAAGGPMEKLGLGAIKATTAFAKMPMVFGQGLASKIGGIVSGLGNVFSGLVRIAKFRLYRTMIKLFTEGMQEGIKNVYAYSQAAGTTLAGSLDKIATAGNYVKNSLGAMAAPIIDILAPAIDFVADKVVALFNLINQAFARLSGKTTYTAAKKVASTWSGAASDAGSAVGDAAKNASDELKRTILAFDEINKLNDADSSSGSGGSGSGGGGGSGSSGGALFEERAIEGGVASFVDSIKNAIDNGDWEGAGRILGDKINQLFDLGGGEEATAKWEGWGKKIAGHINHAIDFAYGFLDETDFENIGGRIAELMNGVFDEDEGIDTEKLARTLVLSVTSAFDMAMGFIEKFDFKSFGSKINGFVTGFFDEIGKWFDKHDMTSFGRTVYEKLKGFFEGLDLKGCAEAFFKALGKSFNAANNFINGITQGVVDDIKQWYEDNIKADTFKETAENILKAFGKAIKLPETFVKEWLIDPFMSGILGEEKWKEVQKVGDDIKANFEKGLKKAFSLFTGQGLTNFILDMFGFGGENNGLELPITPRVENNSNTWYGNILEWWNGMWHGNSTTPEIPSEPENNSRTWYEKVLDWWSGWFGGGKNTQTFNAEGNATGLRDNIPASQKMFQSIANFLFGRNGGIPVSNRTFESVAMFNDSTGQSFLPLSSRTFNSRARFVAGTGNVYLPLSSRTFNSRAKFLAAANYLALRQRTFDSRAKYVTATDYLSWRQKTLDSKAHFVDFDQKKTFKVNCIANILRQSGGYEGFAAEGGVFTSKGKVPITRYASGGLPVGSQLFWAREKGPELVGTLGGRTAVMNNDQIVSSVAAGVAHAVSNVHFSLRGMPTPEPVDIGSYMANADTSNSADSKEMLIETRRQNDLLIKQNALLQEILEKPTNVEVTTRQFQSAATRQNRRDGRTTIPVATA